MSVVRPETAAILIAATIAVFACTSRSERASVESEQRVRAEAEQVAETVIGIERAALERWGRGDPEGFLQTSSENCGYFDPFNEKRLDGRAAVSRHFGGPLGRASSERVEMIAPRVQVFGGAAVLTYNLAGVEPGQVGAPTGRTRWHATAVYALAAGQWRRVSTHRSFTDSTLRRMAAGGRLAIEPVAIEGDSVAAPGDDTVYAMERAALDRWGRGDPDGFTEIIAEDYSYFDPALESRLDGRERARTYYEPVRGKIKVDRWEYVEPRIQRVGDLAVLTFRLTSYTGDANGRENQGAFWQTTEVYHRSEGRWSLVSTHWSYTPSWLRVMQERRAFERPQEPAA